VANLILFTIWSTPRNKQNLNAFLNSKKSQEPQLSPWKAQGSTNSLNEKTPT
jgi:hypothetical protein